MNYYEANIIKLYKDLWKREKLFYKGDYNYKDKLIFKLVMALDDVNFENIKMRGEIEKLEIQLKACKSDAWELQKYIINNIGVYVS